MELKREQENIINLSLLMIQKYNNLVSYNIGGNTTESVVEFVRELATVYNCRISNVESLKRVNLDILRGQIQLLSMDNDVIKNAKPLVSNHHFVSEIDKNILSYLNFLEIIEPGDADNLILKQKEMVSDISEIENKYEVKLKTFNLIEAPHTLDRPGECINVYRWFNGLMFNNLVKSTKIYDELDRQLCIKSYATIDFKDNMRHLLDVDIKENKAYHLKLAYRKNLITMETVIKFSETVNDIVRYLCAMDRFVEVDIESPVTTNLAYQKIKNLKLNRPSRRAILDKIESFCKDSLVFVKNDFFENESIMKLIASKVHPYENYKRYKYSIENVWVKLIKGKLFNSYNSAIEKHIKESNVPELLKIIRGTDLVRRINKISDICKSTTDVELLSNAIEKSESTLKNYIQAYQCIMSRYNSYMRKEKQIQMTNIFKSDRDVFKFRELEIPKELYTVNTIAVKLKRKISEKCELIVSNGLPGLISTIDETLASGSIDKFKLYIDKSLNDKTLPMGNRFKSISFDGNARFSREISNQTKLRAFTHWIGADLDLHCLLLDSNCKVIKNVYFGSKELYVDDDMAVVHSGDVRHAPEPHGANEYVDIDVELLRKTNIKHIIISNSAFNSDKISDYKECYSGITSYDENNINKFITEDVTFKTNLTTKAPTCASLLINIHDDNIEIISIDMVIPDARHGFSPEVMNFTSNLIKYATTYSFFTIYDLLHYGIENIYGSDVEFVMNEEEAHKSITMGISPELVEEYLGK